MKKQIYFLLSLFAVVLLTAACHSEKVDYEIKQEGQLNLSSLQLTPNTDPLVTESRVAAELNDYIVEVYTEAGELVSSWKYAEMPEVYTLKIGNIRLWHMLLLRKARLLIHLIVKENQKCLKLRKIT